jgi:N-acetylmuramoyl-L-alanine amidase
VRQIKRIIWHCSATREGVDVSVDTIRSWHKDRGFSDIGYHYVILLDGSVRDGRPIERVGAHVERHNLDSIGICYVGGVDENGKPKDTRTPTPH